MRIAVFHEVGKGGARRAINEYAQRLKKKHEVDLYTSEKVQSSEIKYFSNVYRFKYSGSNWKGKDWKKKLRGDTLDLLKLNWVHRKIAKKMNEGNYQVAFVNPSRHIQSPFVLRYLDIPTLFYLHDPHYRYVYEKEFNLNFSLGMGRTAYELVARKLRKIIDSSNLRKADYFVANSEYTRSVAKKTYGVSSAVGYLGVNEKYFRPKNIKKKIDVLYIGSTIKQDNFALAGEAINTVGKKIKVKFVLTDKEWYPDRKIRKLYQKSKVVLCLTGNDSFGLIPLEAMACGAIPVAINEGGYKESIRHERTGFLVKKSAVEIAEKIDWILSHPEQVKKMQNTARQEVEDRWTWTIAANKLEKLLLESIN